MLPSRLPEVYHRSGRGYASDLPLEKGDGILLKSPILALGLDLDGTLLRLSKQFIPQYLADVDRWVAPRLGVSRHLSPDVMATTRWVVSRNHEATLLADAFYTHFTERSGLDPVMVKTVFEQYYFEEFPKLKYLARPLPGMMGFLAELRSLGLKIALLTSPLFPRVAIEERLRWAGIEGFPFDWISCFEIVHASKPHPAYYEEAARQFDMSPQHWLMVGNDLIEDIQPARAAGMQTWWVSNQELPQDLRGQVLSGSIYDVLTYLQGLR